MYVHTELKELRISSSEEKKKSGEGAWAVQLIDALGPDVEEDTMHFLKLGTQA